MKIVADTHVLVFYLFTPDRLTDTALAALLEADNTDGIVVSAATLADLWYASQKTSSPAIAPGVHEQIQATILDPTTNLVPHPISAATMTYFGAVPLADLRDPFDRFTSPQPCSWTSPWSRPITRSRTPAQLRSSGEQVSQAASPTSGLTDSPWVLWRL